MFFAYQGSYYPSLATTSTRRVSGRSKTVAASYILIVLSSTYGVSVRSKTKAVGAALGMRPAPMAFQSGPKPTGILSTLEASPAPMAFQSGPKPILLETEQDQGKGHPMPNEKRSGFGFLGAVRRPVCRLRRPRAFPRWLRYELILPRRLGILLDVRRKASRLQTLNRALRDFNFSVLEQAARRCNPERGRRCLQGPVS